MYSDLAQFQMNRLLNKKEHFGHHNHSSTLFIESSYSALFNCHERSLYKSYNVRESHLETCRITFIDTTFPNILRKLALDNHVTQLPSWGIENVEPPMLSMGDVSAVEQFQALQSKLIDSRSIVQSPHYKTAQELFNQLLRGHSKTTFQGELFN